MTTDTISAEVRRSIETLTPEGAGTPVELLFVGEGAVWLVVDPDRIESHEAMIDVFRAVEDVPGVETLYVERSDVSRFEDESLP
ncbi:hypothetical protein Huta_0030 [Halorhabdus utahensis DSM 12940]|uniref:Uncharacterized protein n=1 Tax=Halorhabdus utahensis (strain DSM 12940 / JCM 11049 / AX-2) TaxID=519442 RepID=C7NNJ1_HALUD|nr:hypothetical protein [Halorhabdus utahensis]ACV10219.1 hypothetical protein Huta_0030 [Halorhabdus utahensis DSM 12940]